MIKNSSQIREIRENCRWCDGSILSFGEWTYEGSLKGNRVGADGRFRPLHGKRMIVRSSRGGFADRWFLSF